MIAATGPGSLREAEGIDVSPEQVAIARASGLAQVRHGDHRDLLGSRPAQHAAAAASGSDTVLPCPSIAHGLVSEARLVVWAWVDAFLGVALAAETGSLRGHIITQNLTFAARKAG